MYRGETHTQLNPLVFPVKGEALAPTCCRATRGLTQPLTVPSVPFVALGAQFYHVSLEGSQLRSLWGPVRTTSPPCVLCTQR